MSASSVLDRLARLGAGMGLMLLALPSASHACDITLDRAPPEVRIDYDPFAFARPAAPLSFIVSTGAVETCPVHVELRTVDGQALSELVIAGVTLELRAREDGRLRPASADRRRFALDVAPGDPVRVQLDIAVLSDAVPEAGRHVSDLRLAVLDAADDRLLIETPVIVALESPPRAEVGIAGAAGAFGSTDSVEVLDFGEAVTGAKRQAFLQVRANTESRLSIRSEHGGVLQRTEEPTGPGIPYAMRLDGRDVDLVGVSLHDVDPPRDIRGQSIPMEFELGAVEGAMSGGYEDLITVSISPR